MSSLTISNRTSPAANVSPSFFFQLEMPPSVMVGLMAGMENFWSACRRAETCRPVRRTSLSTFFFGQSTLYSLPLEKTALAIEDMKGYKNGVEEVKRRSGRWARDGWDWDDSLTFSFWGPERRVCPCGPRRVADPNTLNTADDISGPECGCIIYLMADAIMKIYVPNRYHPA